MKALSSEDVRKWQRRIQAAEVWRKPKVDKWERIIGYLEGKYLQQESDTDFVGVNLVHPHIRVIIPAIYSKNPDIIVVPRRKEFTEQAQTMQTYLRYLLKEIGLKEEIKLVILDALLVGHAWMKTGYQTDFQNVGDDPDKLTLIQTFLKMVGLNKKGLPIEDVKPEVEYAIQPNELIVGERPWATRVNPFKMVVPAYSQRHEELPWLAQQIVRLTQDVKNNPGFKNTKGLRPSTNIDKILSREIGSKVQLDDEDAEYSVLYEIYDCRNRCIYTIADEHDQVLEEKDNEYDFLDSRHPYVMLRFNEIPNRFYPSSDIEPWEPQIHELNKTRTQMITHRKRFNRRYVYKEGAFKPSALEDLKNGEDGALVPTDEETLANAIIPIQDAPMPAEIYLVEQKIKDDINIIGGLTDYQRGSLSKGAKTATEASIVDSQSRFRSDERLDVVSGFSNRIARNLAMISQKFMGPDQVFPIVGDAATWWLEIKNPKQIQGEFAYEVVFGSTIPISREVDRQQFMEMYQVFAQNPMIDQIKLTTEMLRKFDQRSPEDWLVPQAMQLVQQLQMDRLKKAILEANLPPGTEETTTGEPPAEAPPVSEEVPSRSSLLGGIQGRASVTTPGGMGGGSLAGL